MPDLILWNSIARRRRSPSDDFLDNGLAILKTYLEEQRFTVEVIDWARSGQWEKMTPRLLARINQHLATLLLSSKDSGKKGEKTISRLIGPVFMLSQETMSAVQKRLQKRMIRELARYVRDSGCLIVGIKCWYGDAYLAAKYFAKCLREIVPDVLIVVGGPHPSIYLNVVLEGGEFDIAVQGEGERALAGLLALAKKGKTREKLLEEIAREASLGHLKNIIYRSNGHIELSVVEETDANKKIIPSYDTMDGKTKIHVVIDSLGCPWGKCNFCTHSCIYKNYSRRNPRLVVDEIEEMLLKGIGIFRFAGSTTDLNHACEIATLLEERGIHIIFSMFARIQPHTSKEDVFEQLVDTYRQLIRSGFRAVFAGAESGVDIINELVMNKGITREDISGTVKAMREASRREGLPLDIGLSLIYPAPTMGKISLDQLKMENIRLIEETNPDSVLVSPPAPFPRTAWFKEKHRFGFELGPDFARELAEYDYVLYKPLFLWPDINVKLEGMSLREIYEECQSLRNLLEDKGYVTEVTDVHFLILRAAGYRGKEGVLQFKNRALLDILSCDYRWTDQLQKRVNEASQAQALLNTR